VSVKKTNIRRLLLTFEALSDLGPEMTAERAFPDTARTMLSSLMDAVAAREGALFVFSDRPSLLTSVAAAGFVNFPHPARIPLLPKHVHSLTSLRLPLPVSGKVIDGYLSANGNVGPELFKCIAPLRVGNRLVGLVALGRREADEIYDTDDVESLSLFCHYLALAVSNHMLNESLAQRVAENLKLLASVHNFYDNALETFASAIDIKHVNLHGHSIRVGRYASSMAEAMGMDAAEVAGVKAAGYLHDIGYVAVDKHIFSKPSPLDAHEFKEMADHTVVGQQIVSGVEFPWPKIPEVVRSHHERADRSGYPDHLALDEVCLPARIVAVADTFDAMTTPRPYRQPLSVGEALSEIVRIAPTKFDSTAVQGLLVQLRRDAVGSNRSKFLDERAICNIAPGDIDVLAAALNHKISNGRIYSA
jgi:putative nucleotidyltransferase with HDIG domain